ncbi:cell envelope integrity EipB family protein [Nitratireductor basaltis]|uniref:ATP-binding protein n=1 Tax=Nitratireductor basaltis TaxID=472175 RepID=A0A084UB57_9HYPH|nr:cell envelope integrity EipB family protein [Nitratireductor basaltis]KFB10193.1 ATP-binding protein [Nitratireductor basaltis]
MRRMHLEALTVGGLVLVFAGTAPAASQALQPHRAVYDLRLSESNDDADIESLKGRWVFEFSGSECVGYTVKSRIVMHFAMTDGPRMIDQRITSFEDARGETFRFVTKSFIDQDDENVVEGTARLSEGKTVVDYTGPQKAQHEFAPALFPIAQLKELLAKAAEGENFYQTRVFDGTEYVEEAVDVTVVLGKPRPVGEDDDERKALGKLAEDEFFPVTAAYFDNDSVGEQVSDYNVSFKLHENGIQRDLLIRYTDYSMKADLVDIELFDEDRECEVEAK